MEDDFQLLSTLRKRLQNFCELNLASVLAFRFEGSPSFKLDTTELPNPDKPGVRHLTSSATCVESLLGCPEYFYPAKLRDGTRSGIEELAHGFAEAALDRTEWKSDASGDIYCRCRTLPVLIDQLKDPTEKQREQIKDHISYIFKQMSETEGERTRFAIGERDNAKPSDSYPANAYHSYWALATLVAAERRKIDTGISRQLKDAVLLWARMKLGTEIALHSAESALLDSDQLAWAMAIFIAFQDSLIVNLAEQDLVRQGLKCLFATQAESGTWRHYQPLFHYQKSGNAYCYNFETFASLLKVMLERHKEGAFYMDALRPYLENLTRLFAYAERSRRPISGATAAGWNTGHRSNASEPESWATASVYSFAQGLRRCVGIWTRAAALADFQSVAAPDFERAKSDIIKCGKSWSAAGRPSVTEQLQTLFVNPFLGSREIDAAEPDACPIAEDQARSAILFGPPGTGKTTLARAVAGQLGWNYVEIHSSHFVSEGMASVQKVADRIFSCLMQLDHAVVLFDEVDELVHTRAEGVSDPPSRFLTTSMLPRLAELWKRRSVIYFINTNYIAYFDSAITRSKRFDALIFVPPPSFEAKRDQLLKVVDALSGIKPTFTVSQENVDTCFVEVCRPSSDGKAAATLGEKDQLGNSSWSDGTSLRRSLRDFWTSREFAMA